jgi:predicted amidohydrolase YtcJ
MAGIKPGQTLTGGDIVVKNGKLTGLLVDNATGLVKKMIPKANATQLLAGLKKAEANCFAVGLTSLQDCGLNYEVVEQLQRLYAEQALQMRLFVMLSDKPSNYSWALSLGGNKIIELITPQIPAILPCRFLRSPES